MEDFFGINITKKTFFCKDRFPKRAIELKQPCENMDQVLKSQNYQVKVFCTHRSGQKKTVTQNESTVKCDSDIAIRAVEKQKPNEIFFNS